MVSMHASPDAQPGSAGSGSMNVAILATALELAARDVEVDLVTRASGAAGQRAVAPGVTLHALAAGETGGMPTGRLATVADEFGEAVAELTRRGDQPYDVIHAHYWLSGIATLPVAIELGIPFVQSFHTLGAMTNEAAVPGNRPEPDRRLWSERYLATQADAIVAVSAAEATTLIDNVGAQPGRVWVIPPGVDSVQFTPARVSKTVSVHAFLGIDANRPILAVVARIQPLKDQELALRALAALPAPRPLLAIVGEPALGDGQYLDRLQRLAVELGVAADVRFIGMLDRVQLANLLASSSLVLMPSLTEPYGLVALEAAASGIPVVASSVGGLSEAVVDGVTGVLVDSRDPVVWAHEIRSLLVDPGRRLVLATAARQRAEGLSWGAAATSLIGVYASLAR